MKTPGLPLLIILIFFAACTAKWENHYGETEESVDVKLWDTLKSMDKYSEYIKYMEFFKLDTFIKSSDTKTLFIPTNEAFIDYLGEDTTGFRETMMYQIIPTFFLLRNVENNQSRRLLTFSEKYVLIQNSDNIYYIDGIEITRSSPLFLDGKFYEIERVVRPIPNLYEYLKWNHPPIHNYIDLQDTMILDLEKSKPLHFNEQGETVYDSVTIISNTWEQEYFPISKEFRNIFATLIIPDLSIYEAALDEMSQVLGGNYKSHEDIPSQWQNNVLIPFLLYKGTFGGLMNPVDFKKEIITNILSDTIIFDIDVDFTSREVCTNGWVYDYTSFSIGDSLYSQNILEPEEFVENIGFNRYTWIDEGVTLEGNLNFQPVKQMIPNASNDTIISVKFNKGYNGDYALSLTMKNVLPQKYRMIWRTQYRISGVYSIYVNGVKVLLGLEQLEEFDSFNLINGFYSVLGNVLQPDKTGFCDIDGWVENLTEYGDVTFRFEYHGPGLGFDNGLSIDYIGLFRE